MKGRIVDLLNSDIPPVQYLVDKLVVAGGITYAHGAAGSGKTYLFLQMALCLATGKKFLNTFNTKKCRVLYIDEESTPRRLKERVQLLCNKLEIKQADIADNFDYWSMEGFKVTGALSKEWITKLVTKCNEFKPDIILIDSIAKVFDGKESYVEDVRQIFENLIPFFKKGIAVAIIHHSRKLNDGRSPNRDDMSGSREFQAQADNVLALADIGKGTFLLKQTKSRDEERMESINFKIACDKDAKGKTTGLVLEMTGTAKDNIRKHQIRVSSMCSEAIKRIFGNRTDIVTGTEIKKAMTAKYKDNAIYDAISLLVDEGTIESFAKNKYRFTGN